MPTGRDQRGERQGKRKRGKGVKRKEERRRKREEASRGVVGPKVRRDQGRPARQGEARRSEAKRVRGPGPGSRFGPTANRFENVTLLERLRPGAAYRHARTLLSPCTGVDSFCRRRGLALKIGPVLTRHRDNIARLRRVSRGSRVPRLFAIDSASGRSSRRGRSREADGGLGSPSEFAMAIRILFSRRVLKSSVKQIDVTTVVLQNCKNNK